MNRGNSPFNAKGVSFSNSQRIRIHGDDEPNNYQRMKSHHYYNNEGEDNTMNLPRTVLESRASKEESDKFSHTMPLNKPKESMVRTQSETALKPLDQIIFNLPEFKPSVRNTRAESAM